MSLRLQDGAKVIGYRVGFGEVTGTIVPAHDLQKFLPNKIACLGDKLIFKYRGRNTDGILSSIWENCLKKGILFSEKKMAAYLESK